MDLDTTWTVTRNASCGGTRLQETIYVRPVLLWIYISLSRAVSNWKRLMEPINRKHFHDSTVCVPTFRQAVKGSSLSFGCL